MAHNITCPDCGGFVKVIGLTEDKQAVLVDCVKCGMSFEVDLSEEKEDTKVVFSQIATQGGRF